MSTAPTGPGPGPAVDGQETVGTTGDFYAEPLAVVHDTHFSDLARHAASHLLGRLDAAGLRRGTVVDLGCGGGVLAALVAAQGYAVVGVDLSPSMIALARRRVPDGGFIEGSIWDVEVPRAVAVTAIGEVVNYAADPRAGLAPLARLLDNVAAALVPGGILLLDVAVPGRAGPEGHTTNFHDTREHSLYFSAREVAADDGAPLLERRMVLFSREGALHRRSDEVHRLRLFDADAVRGLITDAGLVVVDEGGYDGRRLPPGWVAFTARRFTS